MAFAERGEIKVCLHASPSGMPRIEVADTGIGIPADRIQHIFGAFTQGDGSTTRKHGGTGLGLAIANQIAALLGGGITVQSQVGIGSRFALELELKRVSPSFTDERRLLGKRVAVVSEDPELSAFVRGALLSLGAAVVALEGDHDAILFDARFAGRKDSVALPPGRVIVLLSRGTPMPDNAIEAIYEPITRRALIDAVFRASGNRDLPARQPVTGRRARVLLVEDNLVNQRVALRQLELEGMTVDLAVTGLEAIACSSRVDYDLVFMDIQMPDMDGLEATRVIRNRDDALGRHLPIIAMTAHAMKGDRERCLSAGMDDYLSKPLRREDLKEKIMAWVDTKDVAGIETLDDVYLQNAFGEDEDFLSEVLITYVRSTDLLHSELRDALAKDDQPRIRTIAHTLKGSSRSVGAAVYADHCELIETAATPEAVFAAAATLIRETPRLLAACRTRVRVHRAMEATPAGAY